MVAEAGFEPCDLGLMRAAGTAGLPYSAKPWHPRKELNPQPVVLETTALPIELLRCGKLIRALAPLHHAARRDRRSAGQLALMVPKRPQAPSTRMLVGVTRFERATSRSQSECSTRLSYTPEFVAEAVGFGPTNSFPLPVFKTGAIDRSAKPPNRFRISRNAIARK